MSEIRCTEPCAGPATSASAASASGSPSGSTSLATTSIETDWSRIVVATSSTATGGWLVTSTVTQARERPPWPSPASYWKVSCPMKPSWPVYWMQQPETLTAVPRVGATLIGSAIRTTLSPSGSVSLAVTSISVGVAMWTVAVSSTAVGGLLSTVTVTHALARSPRPSPAS